MIILANLRTQQSSPNDAIRIIDTNEVSDPILKNIFETRNHVSGQVALSVHSEFQEHPLAAASTYPITVDSYLMIWIEED